VRTWRYSSGLHSDDVNVSKCSLDMDAENFLYFHASTKLYYRRLCAKVVYCIRQSHPSDLLELQHHALHAVKVLTDIGRDLKLT
jgi:hypothetical protein